MARVRRANRRHALVPPGRRVAVAVSGGPDSVALVHALIELAAAGDLEVAGLAHLNHQLRGAGADADERFCRELAAAVSRPIVIEAVDVRRIAAEERRSIEDAARRARYAFLERAADRLGAHLVAVAHTRNDQAETVLLRLFRGAGLDGLASIHWRRGRIIRPLLDETRADVLEYLRDRSVAFQEDETNLDVSIPRNRIRHELIPLLEARFSPEVVTRLARIAELAGEDSAFLAALADEQSVHVLQIEEGRVTIDLPALACQSEPIRSRLLMRALERVSAGRPVGYDQVDRLKAMASLDGPASSDLPGTRAERSGERLVLTRQDPRSAAKSTEWNNFRYLLSIPGEVFVAEAGCRIEAERFAGPAGGAAVPLAGRGGLAVIDGAGLSDILTVRARRRGDSFRPLGLPGRKKLQDFFVDRKVPRASRDRVPIIVDDRDRIVWVAGHAISEEYRVTDRTQSMVILRLLDLGGRA